MRLLCHLASITMMLCSMIFSKASAVENITLSVSPPNVAIGDTVTVTVGTNSVSPFVFWQVQLGFDASKVQLATQETGTFTTFTGDSRQLSAINSSGYVTIGGDSSGTLLSGTGSLANFTFTATASGSASFDLRTYNASTQPLGTLLADPVTYNFRMPSYTGNPATLTVLAANRAPTVTNVIPAQTATVGIAFSYVIPTNTFADADGDSLTLSVEGLPSWATFTVDTRTISGTSTDAAATVTALVTAKDGRGGTVSTNLSLTVSSTSTDKISSPIPESVSGCGAGGLGGLGMAILVSVTLMTRVRRTRE